jgi:outer membrane lipoprotein-sorting protein
MKNRLILGLLASSLILLGGCASTQTSEPQAAKASAEMVAFQKSYDNATAAIKAAGSVGGEWRDTGKMMKQAKAAAEAGDFEKAQKLIDSATFQAEMGYQQAMAQQNAGPHY